MNGPVITATAYGFTIGAFLVFIGFREILAWKREKELLDRIMARSLSDLGTYQAERRKAEIPDKIATYRGTPL